MRIRTAIWVENNQGQVVYGLGRQRILEAIRRRGSISAAAEDLGMSYRGLWARLRHSERRLGFPLVASRPGRGQTGGTKLTPKALRLLERFEALSRDIYTASDKAYGRYLKRLL